METTWKASCINYAQQVVGHLPVLQKTSCSSSPESVKLVCGPGLYFRRRPQSQQSNTKAVAIWSLVFIATNRQHISPKGQRNVWICICVYLLHRSAAQTVDFFRSGRTGNGCWFDWWCRCKRPTFSHSDTISAVWVKAVPNVKVNEKIKSLLLYRHPFISKVHFPLNGKILFSKGEMKQRNGWKSWASCPVSW